MTKGSDKITFILELFEDAFTCPGFCLLEMTVDGIEGDNIFHNILFRYFMLSNNSTFLNS